MRGLLWSVSQILVEVASDVGEGKLLLLGNLGNHEWLARFTELSISSPRIFILLHSFLVSHPGRATRISFPLRYILEVENKTGYFQRLRSPMLLFLCNFFGKKNWQKASLCDPYFTSC
ncbi:hypothetical protein O6H91_12G079200 [Diphasiastrum complanatum]|uniref:Uncharacterized protein n=2 Tax=Diphasiastrum complanatum TaxID=34168 RepID=A0ACC2C407_DIPCM|nr:hypothetical protein O6H91_12G075500 [Diphasiastrum complanatum]KAJ7536717.1 hypothetical protein O6H91_12G079200 [Diphasiastrum complanatum]